MRIGIDGGTWDNARGYGRFTRELLRALVRRGDRHAYTLFLDPFASRADVPQGVAVVTVPLRIGIARAASADGYRSPADLWAMSRAISGADVDLIFFPSVYTFVPVRRRGRPLVVCIHDVIPERFPAYIFSSRRARLFWMLKVRAAVWQASRLVTVSEHARRGISEHFGVAPDTIGVIHEAAAPVFRPIADSAAVATAYARLGISGGARVVLYFGGISPHKNLGMLLEVFTELVREPRFNDLRLVIAGDYTGDVFRSAYPDLRAAIDARCPERVTFTGRISDETAAHLLNGATVLVLPSLDEGFGLPAVEAAACGTPVVATRSSGVVEVLGDAAIYINPTDAADLRGALERTLEDAALRERMRVRGRTRAAALSWDLAARQMLEMFEGLQAARPRREGRGS